MRQHLALLVDNKPGVLTHVAGLLSRRASNIVVTVEDRWELDQAVFQLAKLIDVIKVVTLDDNPFVSYELAMIKVL